MNADTLEIHALISLHLSSKEKKLLKSMKFPKEYEQKVDLAKVNMEALKPWIAKRVTELLGIEDEVLVGYIYEQLENIKVQHHSKMLALFIDMQGVSHLRTIDFLQLLLALNPPSCQNHLPANLS